MFFEIVTYIYTIGYIVAFSFELCIQKPQLYVKTLLFNPSKVVFITSLIITMLTIPMRYSCQFEAEDYMVALIILFKCVYIFYIGRFTSFYYYLFVLTYQYFILLYLTANYITL